MFWFSLAQWRGVGVTGGLLALWVSGWAVGLRPAIAAEVAPSGPGCDRPYQPKALAPETLELSDTLSDKDIPTGQGGFARDYKVELKAGDRVEIAVSSDSFDPVLALLAADGSTVSENDDGPDGSTNPLLYTRIQASDRYTIRVQTFGRGAGGGFKLKLTLLRPISTSSSHPALLPLAQSRSTRHNPAKPPAHIVD